MKDDWSKDPYLYEDVPVLRNIPGVKNDGELKRIEGDLTKMTMSIVYAQDYSKFNADTLCHILETCSICTKCSGLVYARYIF